MLVGESCLAAAAFLVAAAASTLLENTSTERHLLHLWLGLSSGLLGDGSVRWSKLHGLLLRRGLCGRHDDCGGLTSDNCCRVAVCEDLSGTGADGVL